MSFPKAQNATFTDPMGSTHKFHSANLIVSQQVDNVTGSGDPDVMLLNGLPIVGCSAVASINSGTGFGKSQSSTLSLGTVVIKPYDWTIGKRYALDDVTGSGDSDKVWCNGWPIIFGSIRGWVLATGPLYQTQDMTFSGVFDVFGTVAGSCKIRKMLVGANIRRGGAIPVSIQWQSNGAVTHASGTGHIPRMDTDTDNNPPSGTLAVALDSGETVTDNAVMESVTVRATAQVGGPIVLAANFKFGTLAS